VRFPIDFYEWPVIKKIRTYAAGDTYVVLYQKMMLYAAQVDGCIRFHGYDDTFAKELALILSENPRDLEMTIGYMETHGLIELIGENVFLLPHVPPMIMQEGESTERVRLHRERQKQLPETKKALTSAERVRLHRERKKEEKQVPESPKNRGSKANVTSPLQERYINVTSVTDVTLECNENVTEKSSNNAVEYDVLDGFVTCNATNECNGDVTEKRYTCNEIPVTCAVTGVTSPLQERYKNVTNVTEKTASNPLFTDVLECNVTCNENETFMKPKCNVDIDIDKEEKERGEYAHVREEFSQHTLGSPSSHQADNEEIEEFIKFRLLGSSINNPIAFEESLRRDLSEPSSREQKRFEEWCKLNDEWSLEINELFEVFKSFGQKDRKMCRSLAEDFTQTYNQEVTPMMFELAFTEANKALNGRKEAVC